MLWPVLRPKTKSESISCECSYDGQTCKQAGPNQKRKRDPGAEEFLQRLARKVAGKVVRYRRNITLEPMNAYERHVIHAALQDEPDVSTYSTGSEPNRRIVVAYSRYKSTKE